jgi:UDP-galactopyranose mutase
MWKFDNLIVGAGFSGLTFAERMATQRGETSLVVEKRNHIGGNAYDKYDDHGVLIHTYGPHYFRTNSPKIKDYLGQFTEWHPVNYQILSHTEGRYWNFPINLNTFEQILGRSSTTEEMEAWLEAKRVPIENPVNSEDVIISQVGWELYEKFFKGYTLKQWKRHPKELDASVCGRIPIRTNRDDRYLREEFQALPKAGYSRMFERMVEACSEKVKILYNTDFREILPHLHFRHLVYTGAIDEYFDFEHGSLPYRSLRFEAESFSAEELQSREAIAGMTGFWQPAMQVNYPNEEEFTRIVEVKHATGQACRNTSIVREYPEDYGPGKEAYYPIPAPDSSAQYNKYKELAEQTPYPKHLQLNTSMPLPTVSFIGRLATYRYYNMDQVVGMALAEFEKISSRNKNE